MNLEDEKRLALLAAILHLGGAAPKSRALDTVEALGLVRLFERDREVMERRNELRWRNDLAFIRKHLVDAHYLSDTHHNQWAVTEAGRKYALDLAGRAATEPIGKYVNLLQAAAVVNAATLTAQLDDLAAETTETVATEGAARLVWTTKYERDLALRSAAIRHHGLNCMACNFSFGQTYGAVGEGFIEVHHLHPVSLLTGPTKVNAETDLVVLCSNCHSIVHRRKGKPLSLAELRATLRGGTV